VHWQLKKKSITKVDYVTSMKITKFSGFKTKTITRASLNPNLDRKTRKTKIRT
jgi:hypothetical protein